MITVIYGSKKFEVKSNKIYTPDGIEISESLATEEVDVKGDKPSLKITGVGLQSISMTVMLDCRFVTVDTELRYWKNVLLGKGSAMLMIGNFQVGQMVLTSYKISDFVLAKDGRYIKASIDLGFTEDGGYANKKRINFTKKSSAVAKSATTTKKIRKGSVIKPKSGVRWYYTANGALKKNGKSGKAYQKNMTVTYIYPKTGTITCVNPGGLGWLKVEDVTVVKY